MGMCASLQFVACTHLKIFYNTYIHRSETHDIIQWCTSLLSRSRLPQYPSMHFTWATVQCKMVQVVHTKFFPITSIPVSLTYTNRLACIAAFPSPPPSMKVVECKQLNEGVYTCAWTSCSGYILYNWPLRMHTSTIATRMTRPTMTTATPRQHPITMYTTGIGEAAGRTVCRQWRTTRSLWIAWRNVHWVGGTHTLTYFRYIEKIIILKIYYFGHFGHRWTIYWMHGKEIQLVWTDYYWCIYMYIYIYIYIYIYSAHPLLRRSCHFSVATM